MRWKIVVIMPITQYFTARIMIVHNKNRETFVKMLIVLIPGEEIRVAFLFFSLTCIIISNAFLCFPNLLTFDFHYFRSCGGEYSKNRTPVWIRCLSVTSSFYQKAVELILCSLAVHQDIRLNGGRWERGTDGHQLLRKSLPERQLSCLKYLQQRINSFYCLILLPAKTCFRPSIMGPIHACSQVEASWREGSVGRKSEHAQASPIPAWSSPWLQKHAFAARGKHGSYCSAEIATWVLAPIWISHRRFALKNVL